MLQYIIITACSGNWFFHPRADCLTHRPPQPTFDEAIWNNKTTKRDIEICKVQLSFSINADRKFINNRRNSSARFFNGRLQLPMFYNGTFNSRLFPLLHVPFYFNFVLLCPPCLHEHVRASVSLYTFWREGGGVIFRYRKTWACGGESKVILCTTKHRPIQLSLTIYHLWINVWLILFH